MFAITFKFDKHTTPYWWLPISSFFGSFLSVFKPKIN